MMRAWGFVAFNKEFTVPVGNYLMLDFFVTSSTPPDSLDLDLKFPIVIWSSNDTTEIRARPPWLFETAKKITHLVRPQPKLQQSFRSLITCFVHVESPCYFKKNFDTRHIVCFCLNVDIGIDLSDMLENESQFGCRYANTCAPCCT